MIKWQSKNTSSSRITVTLLAAALQVSASCPSFPRMHLDSFHPQTRPKRSVSARGRGVIAAPHIHNAAHPGMNRLLSDLLRRPNGPSAALRILEQMTMVAARPSA